MTILLCRAMGEESSCPLLTKLASSQITSVPTLGRCHKFDHCGKRNLLVPSPPLLVPLSSSRAALISFLGACLGPLLPHLTPHCLPGPSVPPRQLPVPLSAGSHPPPCTKGSSSFHPQSIPRVLCCGSTLWALPISWSLRNVDWNPSPLPSLYF